MEELAVLRRYFPFTAQFLILASIGLYVLYAIDGWRFWMNLSLTFALLGSIKFSFQFVNWFASVVQEAKERYDKFREAQESHDET